MTLPSSGFGSDSSRASLDYIFHPKSVAVVGAFTDPYFYPAYVHWLQVDGYKGKIYPVNPAMTELLGLPVYPTLKDIPGTVDYVISCLPARLVPQLIEDCGQKGVKVVHLYTARMAETGESDRIEMEREIVRRARQLGMRIIGPNCMGIYYPEGGLPFMYCSPRQSGPVAFLSQSGGNASELVRNSSERGLRFSKAVSYGNAADLNESDLLEYFIQDPQTRFIGIYLEGAKDGRRFLQLLREAVKTKPVVILKGGRTGAGARAVASHTASLAGSESVWEALVKQAGIVPVDSLDEMADVLLAFSCMTPPRGRRVGFMGAGGGGSVQAADDLERVGLLVPRFPPEMRQEVKKFAPDTWLLINNPLDASVCGPRDILHKTARLLADWDETDVLVVVTANSWGLDRPGAMTEFFRGIGVYLDIAGLRKKPMAMVVPTANVPEDWKWKWLMEVQAKLIEAGLPVYPTIPRAARAVSKVIGYYEARGST